MAWMVCFSGAPGVGKSTAARALMERTGALWLRLDAIEQAMRQSHMQTGDLADGGYAAAQAVAEQALSQGIDVIADCVNPIPLTRAAWRYASRRAGARHLDVEFNCSDAEEHRRRVVTRVSDIAGLALPDWSAVQARPYTTCDAALRLDMAKLSPDAAVACILKGLDDG